MGDLYNTDQPSFRERVMALVGESTWREPVEGRSTRVAQIPGPHLVAAALAFGRRHPADIGPDIACDLATGRQGHAVRITRGLRVAMGGDRSRLIQRNRAWLQVIAESGYFVAMGGRPHERPEAMTADDFALLVGAAERILLQSADEAIGCAERARWGERRVA